MAAPQALALVKQIEALTESPSSQCLEEYVTRLLPSLQFFLEHPDSRVRNGSARSLLRLSRHADEDFARQDLSRARAALEKCRSCDDPEYAELEDLLAELFGEPLRSEKTGKVDQTAGSETASTSASSPARAVRSQGSDVIIELDGSIDETVREAIRNKVVALANVVSVTFEDDWAVVKVKSQALASDDAFIEEIVGVLKAQGAHCQQVIKPGFACDTDADPEYIDGEEDDEEPAQLNEKVHANADGAQQATGASWSFFSHSTWTTYRKTQEYHDDPRIAARLAKAKQRREEEQRTRQSRFGMISTWLDWRST